MPNVNIIINQVGATPGTAGTSRDDLASGQVVTLTNDPASSVDVRVWKWTLISWPKLTATEAAPTLNNANTSTATFTPVNAGTYIIELTLNGYIKGRIGAAIKTTNVQFRIPGGQEGKEFPGGWEYALHENLRRIDYFGGFPGGTPSGTADGDVTGTYPDLLVVSGLQGRDVATTAPGNGEVLTWNSGTSKWEPAPAGGGGAAGGDLSGSLPSPTVVGIQGRSVRDATPSDGYVLVWNNSISKWTPQIQDAYRIQNRKVASTAPMDGYLLTWSTSANNWAPAAPASSSLPTISNDGYILAWNNSAAKWSPQIQDAYRIQNRKVASTAPNDGEALVWEAASASWKPGSVASSTPATSLVWVDGYRTDTYIEDGTISKPYKTINAALTSVTDNDYNNRYLINISPGIYIEQIVLKPYVDIKGSSRLATVITSSSGNTITAGAALSGGNCRISSLSVTNSDVAAAAAIYGSSGATFELVDLYVYSLYGDAVYTDAITSINISFSTIISASQNGLHLITSGTASCSNVYLEGLNSPGIYDLFLEIGTTLNIDSSCQFAYGWRLDGDFYNFSPSRFIWNDSTVPGNTVADALEDAYAGRQIQGRNVDISAPTDGYAIVWDAGTSKYISSTTLDGIKVGLPPSGIPSDHGIANLNTGESLSLWSTRSSGSGNVSISAVADVNNATINSGHKAFQIGWVNNTDTFTELFSFKDSELQMNSVASAQILSTETDGASVTAVTLGSSSSYTTIGAKLLSIVNASPAGYERMFVDYSGDVTLGIGNNSQTLGIKSLSELYTVPASADGYSTIQLPTNTLIIGVSYRVTTVIPTATTFSVGIALNKTKYGTGISTAAGTTNVSLSNSIHYNTSATSLLITPSATPGAATGVIRLTLRYIDMAAATS